MLFHFSQLFMHFHTHWCSWKLPRLTPLFLLSLIPSPFLLYPDFRHLVLARFHGRVNYAFWVRRKHQKSVAHLTRALFEIGPFALLLSAVTLLVLSFSEEGLGNYLKADIKITSDILQFEQIKLLNWCCNCVGGFKSLLLTWFWQNVWLSQMKSIWWSCRFLLYSVKCIGVICYFHQVYICHFYVNISSAFPDLIWISSLIIDGFHGEQM